MKFILTFQYNNINNNIGGINDITTKFSEAKVTEIYCFTNDFCKKFANINKHLDIFKQTI